MKRIGIIESAHLYLLHKLENAHCTCTLRHPSSGSGTSSNKRAKEEKERRGGEERDPFPLRHGTHARARVNHGCCVVVDCNHARKGHTKPICVLGGKRSAALFPPHVGPVELKFDFNYRKIY